MCGSIFKSKDGPLLVSAEVHTDKLYKMAASRLIAYTFGKAFHHKQILSLFQITVGVLWSARLGIAAVGEGLANAFGTQAKHGKKQVDRYLSNSKIDLLTYFLCLVPVIVGSKPVVWVTMDWTDSDADDHTTLALALVTKSGRTQPLVWRTVYKSELKGRQKSYERETLRMLKMCLPESTQVTILADRGFGDVKLYRYLRKTLGFHFVIRYKESVLIKGDDESMSFSRDLVPRNGRIRYIRDTAITRKEVGPFNVVLYKAAGMKEPWCLATSHNEADKRTIVNWYSRRFTCEESFRDLKDPRYGAGLRFTRIGDIQRRDRFLAVFALAYLILQLMGVTSEHLGLDKKLRANTVDKRTHSLFQQGRALLRFMLRETYDQVAKVFRELMSELLSSGYTEAFC